jgi:hypothetical protein
MYRKLLVLTLLCAILLVLPACGANQAVSDEDSALWEEAWEEYKNGDLFIPSTYFMFTNSYGTYNGYLIGFRVEKETNDMEYETISIAGSEFKVNRIGGFGFYAYKDKKHIPLEDAYEAGFVSAEAIASVAEKHEVYMQQRFEVMDAVFEEETTKRYKSDFRYLCAENGYHIIFIEYDNGLKFTTQKIAGTRFRHSTYFRLYVYKDGEFIDLEEAYNKGLVSKEIIAAAAKINKEYRVI